LSNLARFAGNSPSERQESQQSAIANYTTALESQSKCVWLLTQRGLLYLDSPDTLPVALSDFRAAAARKPHRASIHRLLAVTLERLGNTEAAAIEQNRARQIYPTTAEDLYWLGHIALYLDGDARTASAFWANCLLIEPESYSGAKDNRTINAPGYNLHFLARVQRALCTGMRDAETQTELRLAAQLSPRLAELCGLNEIAQAMKPPAASTAKQ
jgi:tetratricopeptide (TPR) repeat protein